MTLEPVRVGIVGLGRAGWGIHSKELLARPETFRIVAGCDTLEARRERLAEAVDCATYASIEELVADPVVEVVSIATRSCDHLAHATIALEAGKVVFLEKPITVSYDEAVALRESALGAPGRLFVRHNRRFEAGFRHTMEIIASGILGEVFEVKLRRGGYQRRDDWQTIKAFGGGQLLNWGPHVIDHALQFLGAPVASQWSDLRCVAAAGDAEDQVKIVLRGVNGRVVDLEICGGAAMPEPEYLIWGDRGGLSCSGDTIEVRYLDPRHKLSERAADPGIPGQTFGSQEALPWVEETLSVDPSEPTDTTSIWDALYASLREDAPFPITLEQAVEVMRVVSLAKEDSPFA